MAGYRELPAHSFQTRPHDDPSLQAELVTGPSGLEAAEVKRRMERDGPNLIAEKQRNWCAVYFRYYWGLVPCVIWVAIILQIIRKAWVDFSLLLFLQLTNGLLNWLIDLSSTVSANRLQQALVAKVKVKRDGEWVELAASDLVLGDRIYLKQGDVTPADLKLVNRGVLEINQSQVTREIPLVTKFEGDEVLQGCIVMKGTSEGIVVATGKWINLRPKVAMHPGMQMKGQLAKVFFRMAMWLGIVSTSIVLIILFAVLAQGEEFLHSLSFSMVLLVGSIPIAIGVFSSATVAIGASQMASHGAVVSYLTALDSLASMDVLCVSKTSILTKEELAVQSPVPIDPWTEEDIYLAASLASRREGADRNLLDECITTAAISAHISWSSFAIEEFSDFEPSLKRTEAVVRNTVSGEIFKVTKGAPQVILAMAVNCQEIEEKVSRLVDEQAKLGFRVLGIGRTDDMGHWQMLGLLPIADPIREEAIDALNKARQLGVRVVMVTGDQISIAQTTAERLKLGVRITNSDCLIEEMSLEQQGSIANFLRERDGLAEMYPEDKSTLVQYLQNMHLVVGFTGRSVHDLAVLKAANVGIAMSNACEAAKGAAGLVLLQPGLHKVVESVFRARKVLQRVKNYVMYRLACTAQLLLFFFTTMLIINPSRYSCSGHPDCDILPRTFFLSISSLVVIIILNDAAILALSYDLVLVSDRPEKWNLTIEYVVAIAVGTVAMASSWILLLLSLNNMNDQNPEKVLNYFQVPTFSYGEVMTVIWLKVSVSDYLTLWNVRTQSYMWTRAGGRLVVSVFFLASCLSCLLAAFWDSPTQPGHPRMQSLSWQVIGFVWIFNLCCWCLQEAAKLITYKCFEYYYSFSEGQSAPHFHSDSFLALPVAGGKVEGYRSIVTRRSIASAQEGAKH